MITGCITMRDIFDSMTEWQKTAVYLMTGIAISEAGEAGGVPDIKNVIFNPPATIVFWEDGTKTVVQAREDDIYDPEKGLAMAITKKALGNKHDYYHTVRHWLKRYEKSILEVPEIPPLNLDGFTYAIHEAMSKMYENTKRIGIVKDIELTEEGCRAIIEPIGGDPTCQE